MPRVVVVGSSNTDMTVRVPRLPAAGQTMLGRSFTTTPGGKGANQAVAARRAGAEVVLVTAVGDDSLGQQALGTYRREGVDISYVRIVEGVASGVALIFVDEAGENMIGVAPGANLRFGPDDVDDLPPSLFRSGDVLLVSLEIPIETAIRALRRGFDAGMMTILNPAPAPAVSASRMREILSAAIVLTPNRAEALAMTGLDSTPARAEPDWFACGSRLRAMGPSAVVITLGSCGCQIVDGEGHLVPAPRVQAVDTVGAGDAFNGALAAALAEGRPITRDVVGWASAAAALAVTRPGAQSALPNREEIDHLAGLNRGNQSS